MLASPILEPRRLRVGLIGGVERAFVALARVADAAGCELEVHSGSTAGRGAPSLAALVARVDVVVIVTDVNSHNAVVAARRLCAAHGRRYLLLRRFGVSRLAGLLNSISSMADIPPS